MYNICKKGREMEGDVNYGGSMRKIGVENVEESKEWRRPKVAI